MPSAGELLRDARRRHGLTQAQLAARARTSQAAISRIERDLVSPSVATLTTLLDLMGEELVLEAQPIDYGFDRTLFRKTLAMTPAERIEHGAAFSNFVRRNLGAARVRRRADRAEIDGVPVLVASVDDLIAMKEASGRPKDNAMAAELRAISDEMRAPGETIE